MPDNSEASKPAVDPKVVEKIEQHWINRLKVQNRPYKGAKYEKDEVEFFCGATAALVAALGDKAIPPKWYFAMISGRRVVELDRFK